MRKAIYITTPIFYPNAKPHLGHAYTATVADIIARFHRLQEKEVYFLTGLDENTEKVARAAKAAGENTQNYLDEIGNSFRSLFNEKELNISYDQFIRTSDEKVHWPGAMAIWNKLVESGDIEQKEYEGLYCVGHEAFVTAKELVGGKCPDHNEAPQRLIEKNYFFKLSKYTSAIKERIKNGELKIIPESRHNEILALLDKGLEDVSFSRPADKVSVGIPVPNDSSQKMYVWCDALSNYVSALGYGKKDDSLFKKYWPADLHIIGKDILRFHAAIWPGMLLSSKLPLPKKILVHGFITSGGKKMSKTLGNVISPDELISEYGGESVRWFLARHISPFEDGDITLESFKNAYNGDLANGLGNLVSRVMKMAQDNLDANLRTERESTNEKYKEAFENYNIQRAAEIISEKISALDRKIQETEPFKLVKKDKEKGLVIISELVCELSEIAHLLEPILPKTSVAILSAIKSNKMPEKSLFPRKN